MIICYLISRRLAEHVEGELSLNESARFNTHLEMCLPCCERAKNIRRRIELMRQLPHLDPTDNIWFSITNDLYGNSNSQPVIEKFGGWWVIFMQKRFLHSIVATVFFLIITAALLPSMRSWIWPDAQERKLNLTAYLNLVGTVAAAEPELKEFPTAPGFNEVSITEAKKLVGFPIIAPEILPEGYKLTTVRLHTRGDFHALQFKYSSEKGGVCIFQLPSDSEILFGEEFEDQNQVNGIYCRRINNQTCLLYSFVMGKTQFILMTGQADPTKIGKLIHAFYSEFIKAQ